MNIKLLYNATTLAFPAAGGSNFAVIIIEYYRVHCESWFGGFVFSPTDV